MNYVVISRGGGEGLKLKKPWGYVLVWYSIIIAGALVCIAEGHTAPVKDVRWISASKFN